jgi:hypothetical protein
MPGVMRNSYLPSAMLRYCTFCRRFQSCVILISLSHHIRTHLPYPGPPATLVAAGGAPNLLALQPRPEPVLGVIVLDLIDQVLKSSWSIMRLVASWADPRRV